MASPYFSILRVGRIVGLVVVAEEREHLVHRAAEMSPVVQTECEVEFEIIGVLIKSVQRFKF